MFEQLELFLRIVEKGGMAAAGRELGLSPATVSSRVAKLEEHYGVRLLNRTTRSLSPTAEGRTLLEGARRVLREVEDLDARVRHGAGELAGPIRVSVPVDLGRQWVVPLLDRFLAEHPEVRVDLHLSDGYVDLAGEGFDLAVRYGTLHDSTLRVRKLLPVRRIVCAAPSYLARRGEPQHPDDLGQHDVLRMRFGQDPDQYWPFLVDGEQVTVEVQGHRTSNDGGLVREWCVAGHGIARKSEPDVADDLAAGRLVPLLQAFEVEPVPLQVVLPGGQSPSSRVRALLDQMVAQRERLV